MQCPYCGRDIPDDARWCHYCGAEQAPPEELQDENIPSDGWQDAPADDWDDEAEPPDDSWADDAPVPGWEEDAPYTPAPEDKDAPRSKALLIAIFAALGVALIVLLIALNVKPKPKDPAAAVTPSVTATAEGSPPLGGCPAGASHTGSPFCAGLCAKQEDQGQKAYQK